MLPNDVKAMRTRTRTTDDDDTILVFCVKTSSLYLVFLWDIHMVMHLPYSHCAPDYAPDAVWQLTDSQGDHQM